MSRQFTDPAMIPYINEIYEKEKWLRMIWANRHFENLEACVLKREPTNYTAADVLASVMSAEMASFRRDQKVVAESRRTLPMKDIDFIKLGEKQEMIPAMKPVPENQKELLYTKPKEVYLKKRHLIPPEKKYNFIECESWKYGWQFDQSDFKLKGPAFGKIFHFARMKGCGPQPDPAYYRSCKEITDLCTDMNR